MHISEGFLTPRALAIGWAAAGVGAAISLKKTNPDKIVRVAVMSSAFFLASLIHVKIGPASTHLTLIGPLGLILGWASFSAAMTALLLQAVLFQFGGLLVLGVNTFDMALPALLSYLLFGRTVRSGGAMASSVAAFAAGFCAPLMGAGLLSLFLGLGSPGGSLTGAAKAVFAAHVPLALVEGAITASCAAFLRKTPPTIS
jgi:cobalt/nickel transport system permease protein